MLKKYILTPGPTPVPEKVLLEMAKPIVHHRTDDFSSIMSEAKGKLKKIFGTANDVIILSGSGSAAMESAIVNTLSSGDKVLIVNGGKFGKRWVEIANIYKLNVILIDLKWGKSLKSEDLEKKLKEHKDIKAVLMQSSETSTTVYHPVEEIAKVLSEEEDIILIVDGITSVGVYDTRMDEWGIDVLITGSQKALMLPPGLAFISLSERAQKHMEHSNLPKYYLDFKKEMKIQKLNRTAYTPAVSMIMGLNVALGMLLEEGLQNVYKRHALCAHATREAVKSLGFTLLCEDVPSNAVTGFYLPEEMEGRGFLKYMREKAGIIFSGGQDYLEGKVLRISHLGYHGGFDTIIAISALEMGMKKFGVDIQLGKGVRMAETILFENMDIV